MFTLTEPRTPSPPLNERFDAKDLAYMSGLYREGLDMGGMTEGKADHMLGVAELVGDLATFQALGEKVTRDRQAAEALAEQFKTRRAQEAATAMESEGFAKVAPSFASQLNDDTRVMRFNFNHLPPHVKIEGWVEEQDTEINGLRDLDSFLSLFLHVSKREDGSFIFQEEAEQAQSIQENLTFIGEKEYTEAEKGIATMWKSYLDEDPSRKICAVAGVSGSKKYPGQKKSDEYLRDRIIDTFTDEELVKYSGRIVETLDDIENESPDNVRVVLLDDWTISGRQMGRVYDDIVKNPRHRKFADSVEVNLLVASEERLRNGLEDPDDASKNPLKVKAYYKAHHAENATTANKAHITGLHSTVNFDFGDTIEKLVKRYDQLGIPFDLPPLASVVPVYRKESSLIGHI